jgi:hypothetical protein
MIRQARTYLVGAMSGASLIAVAIAVFVVLVSTQVFGDFPIAGLVGGGEADVSTAKEAAAPAAGAGATAGKGAAKAAAAAGKGGAAGKAGGGGAAGVGGGAQTGGGGNAGSGGGAGGGGGSGGAGSAPSQGSGGSSGGGAPSGGGGGGGTGGETTTSSPSSKVTGTVNETVHQADETVTGGTLEDTGVTGATEEVVESVAGPESPVGKAVDETTKTVEGVTKTVENLGK